MSNLNYKAEQFRRAIQLWAQTLTDESTMMEIADVYPKWSGKSVDYKDQKIVSHGVNDYGETQLYIVIKPHTSQENYTPDVATSLYKKIGFTESGVHIWTQPLGDFDAYDKYDEVYHNGEEWISDYNNNVWEPGVFGWTRKEDGE